MDINGTGETAAAEGGDGGAARWPTTELQPVIVLRQAALAAESRRRRGPEMERGREGCGVADGVRKRKRDVCATRPVLCVGASPAAAAFGKHREFRESIVS